MRILFGTLQVAGSFKKKARTRTFERAKAQENQRKNKENSMKIKENPIFHLKTNDRNFDFILLFLAEKTKLSKSFMKRTIF